jgi:co-chaperonin GroES (HSP10)
MRAIGKYIVIEDIKVEDSKTKRALLLTESHREDIRYRQGKVLNIGTDVIGVKDGDDIYYDKQAGFKLEVKKDIYKVIKEHDVVIVL